MNILVVDDERKIQELYKDFLMLRNPDHKVTITHDGIEAFYKCAFEKFDLILLDYRMPRMNGIDFLAALRSGGLNETTSVIFASGYLPDIETSLSDLPNTYFMKKPMDFRKLENLLQTL